MFFAASSKNAAIKSSLTIISASYGLSPYSETYSVFLSSGSEGIDFFISLTFLFSSILLFSIIIGISFCGNILVKLFLYCLFSV